MRLELLFALWAGAASAQQFTPVEAPPHAYVGGWEHFVGGGLAAFDCDGDRLPELYAAGGADPAILLRNRSQREDNVAFREATPDELALTGVTGAYPLDVDSDGLTDLAILRVGENLLLRGMGDCRFGPFEKLSLDGGDSWTTAFSATWEADESLPTLAFGNYVDRADPKGPFEACDTHDLMRPEGDHYGPALKLGPGYCTLSMLFTDWARVGQQDLRVSNDRHYYVRGGQEQMWAMLPEPRLLNEVDGWIKHELWGMGIASRDISGDGWADVFLTSMGDQRFQLAQGGGVPGYVDAAYDHGLTAHRPFVGDDGRPSTGWHAVWGDVQNDGRDDLFVAKGNVEQMPGSAFEDPNNLLVQQQDGDFSERAEEAGVASMARSRGAAMVDFDLDGRLDIAVVNRRAAMEIYRNTSPEVGNWLGIRLLQSGVNRDAIGAWIELEVAGRVQVREITVGGGHAGGVLGPEHFGLGSQAAARLRVIWPDRVESDWITLDAGRYVTVKREATALLIGDY